MPNTWIYPQHSEESLRAAVNNAFASVDPVGLQQDIEYFQWKLANVFKLPRRFLGFTDEELAANSEYQRAEHRRTERAYERVRNAERYQRQIARLMDVQEIELSTLPDGRIYYADGRIYYADFIYGKKEKPLSDGFAFKLKKLTF